MHPIELIVTTVKTLPRYTHVQYRNARDLGLTRRNAARFALGQAMLAVRDVIDIIDAKPPEDESI